MTRFDPTRRQLLKASAAAAGGAVATARLVTEAGAAPLAQAAAPATVNVLLRVNGAEHQLMIDPRSTLLDALRERLHLTGTKKACDQGQCGACTVIVDGRRITSCLTPPTSGPVHRPRRLPRRRRPRAPSSSLAAPTCST